MPERQIQPYLYFGGRCEEALEFYRTAIGAEVEFLMRYDQGPEPLAAGRLPPGFEKKVMHASFRVGETRLMASDGCDADSEFNGFSLYLAVPTEGDADQVFEALSHGGQVQIPLSTTFWSPKFGMLTDKFGITWKVTIRTEPPNQRRAD